MYKEFFIIHLPNCAKDEAALNKFIQSHRVIASQIFSHKNGDGPFISVILTVAESLQRQPEGKAAEAANITPECNGKKLGCPARDMTPEEKALFIRLLEWRSAVAKREHTLNYNISKNDDLKAVAIYKPRKKSQLAQISGYGQKRIEKYGAQILKVLEEVLGPVKEGDGQDETWPKTEGVGTSNGAGGDGKGNGDNGPKVDALGNPRGTAGNVENEPKADASGASDGQTVKNGLPNGRGNSEEVLKRRLDRKPMQKRLGMDNVLYFDARTRALEELRKKEQEILAELRMNGYDLTADKYESEEFLTREEQNIVDGNENDSDE